MGLGTRRPCINFIPGGAKIGRGRLWLRRVVNIAAELFLRRSRDLGGVKIAVGWLVGSSNGGAENDGHEIAGHEIDGPSCRA